MYEFWWGTNPETGVVCCVIIAFYFINNIISGAEV